MDMHIPTFGHLSQNYLSLKAMHKGMMDEKPMESEQVEWKLDWKDECLKSVCAFANSDAGSS